MNSGYFGKAGEYLNTWGQQSWLWLPISKPTLRTASIHKTWAVCRQTPCTFPICSSFCSTFCFTAAWKKNKIKLASPAFKQTLVCIQGDGKGLQSEIYKRTWILDKKTPNKSEKRISPNKSKVALKLNPFWLILYTRKKMMLDWHPPPPNSHPVAYRTVADWQWYFSSEMADWIFIYFY